MGATGAPGDHGYALPLQQGQRDGDVAVAHRGAIGRHHGRAAKMTTAMPDRVTHHCDIIETGNTSWRFKNRN